MTNAYARGFTEVIEIIKHFSVEEYNKIPQEKIEYFEKNKDQNYIFKINPEVDLSEQNISQEANAILVSLFRNYFATEDQKQKMDTLLNRNQRKLEEAIEDDNQENLFETDTISTTETSMSSSNDLALIVYQENFVKKMLNKIKCIFRMK